MEVRVFSAAPAFAVKAQSACYEKAVATKPQRGVGGLDLLRLGKPASPKRNIMKCVYILQSLSGEHFYTGLTDDLKNRLKQHNAGEVPHTSKHKPWRIKTYLSFSDEKQAVAFEQYLKTASGRAFAKKRL